MMVIVRCVELWQAMELIDYLEDRGYDKDFADDKRKRAESTLQSPSGGFCFRFNTTGRLNSVSYDYYRFYRAEILENGHYQGITEITEFEDFKKHYMKEEHPNELLDFLKGYAR